MDGRASGKLRAAREAICVDEPTALLQINPMRPNAHRRLTLCNALPRLEHVPFLQTHLTLRRARSACLEGWATPRLRPTLRDAPLRGAPQGEVVVAWFHCFGICASRADARPADPRHAGSLRCVS
jgi:hypothetical protein